MNPLERLCEYHGAEVAEAARLEFEAHVQSLDVPAPSPSEELPTTITLWNRWVMDVGRVMEEGSETVYPLFWLLDKNDGGRGDGDGTCYSVSDSVVTWVGGPKKWVERYPDVVRRLAMLFFDGLHVPVQHYCVSSYEDLCPILLPDGAPPKLCVEHMIGRLGYTGAWVLPFVTDTYGSLGALKNVVSHWVAVEPQAGLMYGCRVQERDLENLSRHRVLDESNPQHWHRHSRNYFAISANPDRPLAHAGGEFPSEWDRRGTWVVCQWIEPNYATPGIYTLFMTLAGFPVQLARLVHIERHHPSHHAGAPSHHADTIVGTWNGAAQGKIPPVLVGNRYRHAEWHGAESAEQRLCDWYEDRQERYPMESVVLLHCDTHCAMLQKTPSGVVRLITPERTMIYQSFEDMLAAAVQYDHQHCLVGEPRVDVAGNCRRLVQFLRQVGVYSRPTLGVNLEGCEEDVTASHSALCAYLTNHLDHARYSLSLYTVPPLGTKGRVALLHQSLYQIYLYYQRRLALQSPRKKLSYPLLITLEHEVCPLAEPFQPWEVWWHRTGARVGQYGGETIEFLQLGLARAKKTTDELAHLAASLDRLVILPKCMVGN